MSRNPSHQFSIKAACVGIAIGATLALLFAATGNPGLIGVGAAIGTSIAITLDQCLEQSSEEQNDEGD